MDKRDQRTFIYMTSSWMDKHKWTAVMFVYMASLWMERGWGGGGCSSIGLAPLVLCVAGPDLSWLRIFNRNTEKFNYQIFEPGFSFLVPFWRLYSRSIWEVHNIKILLSVNGTAWQIVIQWIANWHFGEMSTDAYEYAALHKHVCKKREEEQLVKRICFAVIFPACITSPRFLASRPVFSAIKNTRGMFFHRVRLYDCVIIFSAWHIWLAYQNELCSSRVIIIRFVRIMIYFFPERV